MSPQQAPRRWPLLALLLLAGGIALVLADRISLNAAEAHLVWQIYPHDWPNLDAGAGAALRTLWMDFQQVWERRVDIWPLYPMLLNAWAFIFGESQLVLRLPNGIAGLLALVALAQLLKNTPYRLMLVAAAAVLLIPGPVLRLGPSALLLMLGLWSTLLFLWWRQPPKLWRLLLYLLPTLAMLITGWGGWLVLLLHIGYGLLPWLRTQASQLWRYLLIAALLAVTIAPLLITTLTAPHPDWQSLAQATAEERDTRAPALYALPDDHPLAYYDRQVGLLDGIAINLGWRRFTPPQIYNVVRRLRDQSTVWVLTSDDAYGLSIQETVSERFQPHTVQSVGDVLIIRYDLE